MFAIAAVYYPHTFEGHMDTALMLLFVIILQFLS